MIILLLSNRHRTTFLNFRSYRRSRRRRLRGADFTHKHLTRIPVPDQVFNDHRMFSIYLKTPLLELTIYKRLSCSLKS